MRKRLNRKCGKKALDKYEFLTPEESEALARSIAQPTPGHVLERFIWQFESGSVRHFAAKVGYHPDRISARLFHRMAEAHKLSKKDREFWGKRLLGI